MKPWDDLDGASWRDNEKNFELQKRKDEANWIETWYHERTPEEGIKSPRWNKNKNYVMLTLHQLNLMTSNGLACHLFFLKRLKRDTAQTWEGLQRTTGRILKRTNELIRLQRKRNLERSTVRIESEWRNVNESPWRISRRMKLLEGFKIQENEEITS